MSTVSSEMRSVLITGANGQDGTYLIERLLDRGVEIHGLCHTEAAAADLTSRFAPVNVHTGDLSDPTGMGALVGRVEPSHIVNLAGNTSVERSWVFPAETADVLGVGPVRLLHAAWNIQNKKGHLIRFLQASSAEIFGSTSQAPQREDTPLHPVTPYGAAKSFAHQMVGVYRARGMFASTAILYNHESPRRLESFVARKITQEAARISLGLSDRIVLGNIDVFRDWGYAPDYVDGMIRILESDEPDDFIVATGKAHSVRQFAQEAFSYMGIDDWTRYLVIDPALFRPADPRQLVGDPSKLRALGWAPSVNFVELVRLMVDADLARLRKSQRT